MNRALLGLAAALLAAPASAQLMGAKELKVAVPVKGVPSSKPVADVYYLVGESGARETYTFAGKGPANLTLFGPDGTEILTASGSGIVKLDIVLPFTGVFTLSIARKAPAPAYSLTRKTTVPTALEAEVAAGVGYRSKSGKSLQCWITPGVKLRYVLPNSTVEFTIAADRKSTTFVHRRPKETTSGETSVSYDGTQFHYMTTYADGTKRDEVIGLDHSYRPGTLGSYAGYLCKD